MPEKLRKFYHSNAGRTPVNYIHRSCRWPVKLACYGPALSTHPPTHFRVVKQPNQTLQILEQAGKSRRMASKAATNECYRRVTRWRTKHRKNGPIFASWELKLDYNPKARYLLIRQKCLFHKCCISVTYKKYEICKRFIYPMNRIWRWSCFR